MAETINLLYTFFVVSGRETMYSIQYIDTICIIKYGAMRKSLRIFQHVNGSTDFTKCFIIVSNGNRTE